MAWPRLFKNSNTTLCPSGIHTQILSENNLIETNWGNPITLVVSQQGETQKIGTIEQAFYWLRKKWPVADHNRDLAIDYVDAAMHCMVTVGAARKAFLAAAKTAGFMLGDNTTEMSTAR